MAKLSVVSFKVAVAAQVYQVTGVVILPVPVNMVYVMPVSPAVLTHLIPLYNSDPNVRPVWRERNGLILSVFAGVEVFFQMFLPQRVVYSNWGI